MHMDMHVRRRALGRRPRRGAMLTASEAVAQEHEYGKHEYDAADELFDEATNKRAPAKRARR